MSNDEQYSDEFINAYISDELSIDDKIKFAEALNNDDILHQRYSQLFSVKQGIQLAYSDVKSDTNVEHGSAHVKIFTPMRISQIFAVITVFVIGVFSGMTLLSDKIKTKSDEPWRVVLHVSTVDHVLQKTLIDEIEHLLNTYDRSKLKIEVVAYGPGLELFSLKYSKYATKLVELHNKYPNLSFAACGRTIKRIVLKTKKYPILLPNTYVAPSGIRQILKRRQEGWSYIRI